MACPALRTLVMAGALAAASCVWNPGAPARATGPDARLDVGDAHSTDAPSESAADARPAGADSGPGASDGGPGPCAISGECSPYSPVGCAEGLRCLPAADGQMRCVSGSASPVSTGEPCRVSTDCGYGQVCLDVSDGAGARCRIMCPQASVTFCPGDQICAGDIGAPCTRACIPRPTLCSITAQDCPEASQACTLGFHPLTGERVTICMPNTGTQGIGQACGTNGLSCQRGLVCIQEGTTPTCFTVCTTDGSGPACPTGASCVGVSTGWGVTYCK